MSDTRATTPSGWEISARTDGDVLAARARGHGIELALLSRFAGHDPAQIQGWLTELIGVAVETSHNDPGDRPVSALLRHALTGLLFSHAELWHHTPDDPPCSMAFLVTHDRVAFGWAGPAEVELGVGGQRFEGPFIRVRDPDGREAQAVEVEAWQRVSVSLRWRAASGGPAMAEVRGEWQGRAATQVAPAATAPNALPEWRVPSWMGQQAPWEQPAPAPEPAPPPAAYAPPAPSPVPPAIPPGWPTFAPPPAAFAPPAPATPLPLPIAATPPPVPSAPEPAPEPAPKRVALPDGMRLTSKEERAAELAAELSPGAPATPGAVQPMTVQGRAAELSPEPPPPPAMVQSMTVQERAVELSPEPPPPPPPAVVTQMTMEERAAELSPEPPAPAAPAAPLALPRELLPPELVPDEPQLEIIQKFEPGAPAGPPPGIELVRSSQAVVPTPAPAPPVPPRLAPFPATPAPAAPARPPAPSAVEAYTPTPPPAAFSSAAGSEIVPAGASITGDADFTAWSSRTASGPVPGRSRRPTPARRPAWPSDAEPQTDSVWKRGAPIAIGVLVVFAIGWALGGFPGTHRGESARGPWASLMQRVGLGPARFHILVDSHPQGAWIALDGRDLARRTPATIEAAPGSHQVRLSVANLGHADFQVHGARNDRVGLDPELWGTLTVNSMDKSVAVKVSVDGTARGLAPVTVDSLAPGVHQVQFWSPGAGSWDQIVEVRVREDAVVGARPFASPSTGLLEVRATLNSEGEPQSVAGALVWLDGETRGVTPLQVELPRGPHSVRIAWHGVDSPVQLIDLPGGNQRFASFEVGGDSENPSFKVAPFGRITAGTPTVISATLEGVSAGDVRDMWLHVSTPEGQWRRFAMNVVHAPGGVVGTALFPAAQLDTRGRARLYASLSTRSGEELFTDIQSVLGPSAASTAGAR